MKIDLIKNDCMKVFRNIDDNSVQLILTDIPYGEVSKNGEERAKYSGQLRNINKGNADEVTFNLEEFLEECYRVCKGTIYIFCGIEQLSSVFNYFKSKKDCMVRQCAWKKTNPSPSNGQHMWLSGMENCVFIKRERLYLMRVVNLVFGIFQLVEARFIQPKSQLLYLKSYY